MLVYLDIDGVMVPANSWRKPEILEDGFPAFSSKATNSLNKILSNSSADIVLTTSHKSNYSLKEWRNIFKRRNIPVNRIKKLPKNRSYLNRKDELLRWLSTEGQNEKFIIIDDDKSLNSLPNYLKEKLIQTYGGIGLTEDLADEALNLIKRTEFEPAE